MSASLCELCLVVCWQVGGVDPRWTCREQLVDGGVPIAATARKRKHKSKPASVFLLHWAQAQEDKGKLLGRSLKKPEVSSCSSCSSFAEVSWYFVFF